MKKSRFTEEQIIGFLKRAEAGTPIKELCQNGGFSDATLHKWSGGQTQHELLPPGGVLNGAWRKEGAGLDAGFARRSLKAMALHTLHCRLDLSRHPVVVLVVSHSEQFASESPEE